MAVFSVTSTATVEVIAKHTGVSGFSVKLTFKVTEEILYHCLFFIRIKQTAESSVMPTDKEFLYAI